MVKLACALAVVAALAGLLVFHFSRQVEAPPGPAPVVLPGNIHDIERLADEFTRKAFDERNPKRFEEAARLLAAALAVVQERDRVYTAQATLLMQKNDYFHRGRPPLVAAKKLLDRALAINPRCSRALEFLAQYHEFHEQHAEALAVDQRWLAVAPNELRALAHKGKTLVELERYGEAGQVLKQALERARKEGVDDVLVKVQEFLGKAYMMQGKFAEAEAVLLRSVQTFKQSKQRLAACPYTALGVLYSTMGRQKKAAAADMKAADGEPEHPWMQHRAAVKCFWVNDLDNALKYVRRALALKKDPAYTSLEAGILHVRAAGEGTAHAPTRKVFLLAVAAFEDHRFDAARRLVRQARAVGGWQARHRVLQGFLLLLEKKYKAAGEQFREAARAGGGDMGAHVGQGHLAIIRKDYQKARRLLSPVLKARDRRFHAPGKESLKTSPYPWLVYRMACLGMGWASANVNLPPLAISYFNRVIAGKDDDIFAWLGKGNSLNALNKLDAAEKALRRVLALDPGNKYATAELALVKYNKGQNTEAERLFKAALKQDDSQYTCPHEGLGLIYLRAGKLAKAKDSFRKAIKINPDIEFKKFNGLAKIFIREDKYVKARKLLRKSMQNYPYDDEAKKLLASIKGK